MRNTTYYNLNIVEGSDIVNPLTVDNPNYEKIDETMHDNAVSGVTLATEIANATVHAITRENSECAVIRFIATSVWKAGDTATVDGVPVTALLPSGETLPDGAYVINSNVLCILTGTNMTVFAERKKTDTASDIKYNATNVGAELDKINLNLGKMKHSTNIVGNVTGGYGSCNNLICSCFVYDGMALCTMKMDSCRGVFDIYLSSFGLPAGASISNVNNPRLASNVIGANGQVLNINCVPGEAALQIGCGETADSYNFMFPVFITLPNNK